MDTPTAPTVTRPYAAELTHTMPSARVTEELRNQAEGLAVQSGISLSELVRLAVTRFCSPPAPPSAPSRPDVEMLRQAWLAGARTRGGTSFEHWLMAFSERMGWTQDTPDL